ncbi:hypothetical protein F5B20DRAFT_531377 [Whalleya microplaca]|nr:hypothetical protein F5B20DRAFT_531377 [Whalleya microplaca]
MDNAVLNTFRRIHYLLRTYLYEEPSSTSIPSRNWLPAQRRPTHSPVPGLRPSTSETTSHIFYTSKGNMEDLRHAERTVAMFATYIDLIRPENRPLSSDHATKGSTMTKRQASDGSSSSQKGSKRKGVGKGWGGSAEGQLWNSISNTLADVAQKQGVSQTALKVFISQEVILDLGAEFVRHYRDYATEKSDWVAEDLFFDLQSVKEGDVRPSRWIGPRVHKREWDLADHLARFVLAAENFRLQANREDWNTWGADFASKVGLYLSILRCFTVKDAKQRQAAREKGQGQGQGPGPAPGWTKKMTSSQDSGGRHFRRGRGAST